MSLAPQPVRDPVGAVVGHVGVEGLRPRRRGHGRGIRPDRLQLGPCIAPPACRRHKRRRFGRAGHPCPYVRAVLAPPLEHRCVHLRAGGERSLHAGPESGKRGRLRVRAEPCLLGGGRERRRVELAAAGGAAQAGLLAHPYGAHEVGRPLDPALERIDRRRRRDQHPQPVAERQREREHDHDHERQCDERRGLCDPDGPAPLPVTHRHRPPRPRSRGSNAARPLLTRYPRTPPPLRQPWSSTPAPAANPCAPRARRVC